MSTQNKATTQISIGRQIRSVLDQEWESEGIGSIERDENRLLADRFAEELASGYTEDEIKAAWKSKTNQEILQSPLLSKSSKAS